MFRASEHVPPIVDDVIRLGIPYLWLQDGVIHDEAVARAAPPASNACRTTASSANMRRGLW